MRLCPAYQAAWAMCSAALSRESDWWEPSPLLGWLESSQALASSALKHRELVLPFPVWVPLFPVRGRRFQESARLFPTGIDSCWVETRSASAMARYSAPLYPQRVLSSD